MSFAAVGSAIVTAVVQQVVQQVVQAIQQAATKASADQGAMQDAPQPNDQQQKELADKQTREQLAGDWQPGGQGGNAHQMRAFHTNEFARGVAPALAKNAPPGVSTQDLVEEFKRGNAGLVNQLAQKLNVPPQTLFDAVKADLDAIRGPAAAQSSAGTASNQLYASGYDGQTVDHSQAIGGYHQEAPSAEIWAGQFYQALKVQNPDGSASVSPDTLKQVVDELRGGSAQALATPESKGLQASANAYDGDLQRFLSEVASSLEKVNATGAGSRGGALIF